MKIRPRPGKGERPDRCKTWQLTWELPAVDGKRRQETLTFHGDQKAAEKKWRERQAEIDRDEATNPEKVTVSDYLDRWLRDYVQPKLAPKTAHDYAYAMKHYVVPRIGKVRLQDLRGADVQGLYAELLREGGKDGRPLSPRTVRLVHTLLREALARAVRGGILTRNAADGADPPGQRRTREVAWFTPEEMWRLVAAAKGHRLEGWFWTAWATGARPGELLALRWDDVDFGERTLRIHAALSEVGGTLHRKGPKTPKGRRTLYFPPEGGGFDLFEHLKAHRVRQTAEKMASRDVYQDEGLVFCTELGRPLRWSNLRRLYEATRAKAGVPPHPPYALRHTCASHMLQAGVPLHEVSEWLGHGGYAITKDVYGHLSAERVQVAAATMAAFVGRRRGRKTAEG